MTIDDLKSGGDLTPQPSAALFGEGMSGASDSLNWRECFPEIVGRSEAMQTVLQLAAKSAKSDCSVLIHGDSGTGKELIAAALHRLSNRSNRRFVAINCSAIPETLLESELFGHEKGAFTGATGRKAGYFEMAHQGTLFLDEIGDMPQRLQAKLLRVLQEKQYTPVGGHALKKADVRIVAATNVDLDRAVKDGKFRLDLYYRLNVLPIKLPSLRDRKGDVYDLLHHFLDCSNRTHQLSSPCYFSDEALTRLAGYDWPGNVRELQNVVERLVIFARGGEISTDILPDEIANKSKSHPSYYAMDQPEVEPNADGRSRRRSFSMPTLADIDSSIEHFQLNKYIEELENRLIMEALSQTSNNKQQAAKLLGLNRTTLVERIKKRKLQVK